MGITSRKRWLVMAIAAMGVSVTAIGSAKAADKDLNVLIWGATWQTAIKGVSEEFTKQTGIKVNLVPQASSGEGLAKLQAMRQKPTVDVWFTTASVATRAQEDEKLFVPLTKAQIPNLKNLSPGAATEYYAPIYSYPTSIIYRTDLVTKPINTWSDLWDKRFHKKLAMPAMGFFQGRLLMIAAGKDGGDPMDEKRGFAELEKLKPNVVLFYGSDSQARQALAQGEASVEVGPPSHAKRIADAGFPVKVVSPRPTVMNYDVMMLVNGSHKDDAAKYIDFMLSKHINEAVAAKLGMAAVNIHSKQPPGLKSELPKPQDEYIPDEKLVNKNIGRWIDIYNSKIAN
jgi:putative spermidine/putrescine transport system substrate-binding protein